MHCVVFAGLAAKRPIDRCTTGSRLSRFAHSASPEALKPPSLSTRRRASTDFPPRSRADALPRQTAIKGCAAPPRPFRDSDPEIAAVSATFTDTHPKHSSIRFEKAAFMTIRSNTNATTISNAIDRAAATAHPHALGGKSSGSASTTPKSEIAFIDPGVDDLQTLLKGIRPDVEPVLLSRDEPAMRQIAGALKGRGALEAIHVIAHGKPGEISFSSGSLTLETLPPFINELAVIGAAVADGGPDADRRRAGPARDVLALISRRR